MKLWIDDCRPAPIGYTWCHSVHEAKIYCCQLLDSKKNLNIDIISLDHDAGNFAYNGGDYIKLLDWLEEKSNSSGWTIKTKFHIHSMNVVGRMNMRAIIRRNGWEEIF